MIAEEAISLVAAITYGELIPDVFPSWIYSTALTPALFKYIHRHSVGAVWPSV